MNGSVQWSPRSLMAREAAVAGRPVRTHSVSADQVFHRLRLWRRAMRASFGELSARKRFVTGVLAKTRPALVSNPSATRALRRTSVARGSVFKSAATLSDVAVPEARPIEEKTSSSMPVRSTRLDWYPRMASMRSSGTAAADSRALSAAIMCARASVISRFTAAASWFISRSTGRPFWKCSATISGTSAGVTPEYQTPSGYTTKFGPRWHNPIEPHVVTCTVSIRPRAPISRRSASITAIEPRSEQHGAPSGLR